MQIARQLSVSLVNKPGRLAAVLDALAKEKVGIRVFAVMDSASRGVLRMIPDDAAAAESALARASIACDGADVLLVSVSKESGGLPKICRRLAEEHLNIDYAYGSGSLKQGSLAVIKVNDLTKAQKVLGVGAAGRAKPGPGRRPNFAR